MFVLKFQVLVGNDPRQEQEGYLQRIKLCDAAGPTLFRRVRAGRKTFLNLVAEALCSGHVLFATMDVSFSKRASQSTKSLCVSCFCLKCPLGVACNKH
jgi:hypothetical protein